jgi:phage-related baseplate assembly protein
MTTSLAELLSGDTQPVVLQRLLELLTLGGFPATAWQTLSVPRQLVQAESTYLADLSQTIAAIAQGGFLNAAVQRELSGLDRPGSSWLELLATNFFQVDRNPALFTQGVYTLSDVGKVGPVTISAGALTVAEASKTYLFTSTAPVTVPLGGSATVAIQAASPGAAYNLGNGQIQTFVTSYPGLAGANVPPAGAQSWITQQGADVEDPVALANRCRNRWASISAGGTTAYYQYFATTGFSEVARTKISEDVASGIVTVILAGANGPVSTATLQAVTATLQAPGVRGLCIRMNVQNAVPSTSFIGSDISTVIGTLFVDARRDLASTVSAAQNAVLAYARTLPIGGAVIANEIVEAVLSVPGTTNWKPTNLLSDVQLAVNMVWTPLFAIIGSR